MLGSKDKQRIRYRVKKGMDWKSIAQETKIFEYEVIKFIREYNKLRVKQGKKLCTYCDTEKEATTEYFPASGHIKKDGTKSIGRKCKTCKNRMRRNDTILNNDRAKDARAISLKRSRRLKDEGIRMYKLASEMTPEELAIAKVKRKLGSRKKRKKKLDKANERIDDYYF